MPRNLRRGRAIIDMHRLDHHRARRGQQNRQQRRLERQQALPIAGRTLWEQRNRLVPRQRRAQRFDLSAKRASPVPRHKQRIILGRQPPDDRPARNPVMRDECGGGCTAQHQYIDPADMIGDNETVAVKGMPFYPRPRTDGPCRHSQKAGRPGRSSTNGPP